MENNIQAFPQHSEITGLNKFENFAGMTLLDYFAGLALQGYLSNPAESIKMDAMRPENREMLNALSLSSYMQAAAMLEMRQRFISNNNKKNTGVSKTF